MMPTLSNPPIGDNIESRQSFAASPGSHDHLERL
jgi:hypothetical protein